MNFWDERYNTSDYAYGTAPNDFLAARAALIPAGAVLCLADGEGRNSVHLASLGYAALAVDLSPVGLAKAAALAVRANVKIRTEVADLGQRPLERDHWSGIVSIFAHMPSSVRRALHARVIDALRPGGVFILEAYTPRQLEIGGIGGPGSDMVDYFMSLAVLREELTGLEFIHASELDREVNEGSFHRGLSAVVQIVARKI